jgi:RuvB-like protein 1 (pontin 52)
MTAPAAQPGTIITQPPPPAANRESRIAAHSHIKGLGLADDGTAMESSQGFVGQRNAREALGLHLALLRQGRHSGRPLLLVGPPGTGKVSCECGERSCHGGEGIGRGKAEAETRRSW